MLTSEQIGTLMSVDLKTVDKMKLADISGIPFDNSLSKPQRMERIITQTGGNPFCFRYRDMAIKLAFCDEAQPLEDIITDFLIRKKSGL